MTMNYLMRRNLALDAQAFSYSRSIQLLYMCTLWDRVPWADDIIWC